MQVRFRNSHSPELKQYHFLMGILLLIVGIPLFLLGCCGYIIDWFFPSFADSYHNVAGTANGMRLLIGALMLYSFYRLRKHKNKASKEATDE